MPEPNQSIFFPKQKMQTILEYGNTKRYINMANAPSPKYRFFDSEISEILSSELDEYGTVSPLNHELHPSMGLLGYFQLAGAFSLPIIWLLASYLSSLSAILPSESIYDLSFSR